MTTFYISPSGNDASSGLSATGNGSSGPFATLARAQQAVEANPGTNTVYLLGGTYSLTSPLSLTSADSNTTFAAYSGQQVTLRGGVGVSGWTAGSNGVWTAYVPLSDVEQLTVNGVAQQLARFPDYDPVNPITGGWAWARTAPSRYDPTSSLSFDKSVFAADQLAAGEKVVMITAEGYTTRLLTVATVDYAAGVMTFNEQTDQPIGPGARFYVEGARSLLGKTGTWWFDKTTQTISFVPPAGFSGTGAVVAGGDNDLIDIDGATGITISGLSFANSATNAGNVVDTSTAISVTSSSGITVKNSRFQNLDEGVRVGDGSSNVTVSGNTFRDLTSAAVELGPNSSHNKVVNNTISNVNTLYRTYGGIQLTESWGNDVAHNLIQNVPRSGIYEANYDADIKSGANIYEYNKILHTGQQAPDTGSLYVVAQSDSAALGDTIRYNYILDSGGKQTVSKGFAPGNTFSWGIYLDDYTSDAKVYGNFVSGTAFGGFNVHMGTGNQLYNNVFISSAGQYGGWLQDEGAMMTGTSVHNNVIELPQNGSTPIGLDIPNVSPSGIYDNVYVNPTGAPVTATFDDSSYAAWQAQGGDARSVITASAGFVDEAAGNYAFAPGSAALADKIPQLPFSQMGLLGGTTMDVLVLRVSEDAWNGDAQFTVKVDGTQVGGPLTASALHRTGDSNVFVLTGHWGSSKRDVQPSFINHATGGTATTERNLYVDSIAYDGVTASNTTAAMLANGARDFSVGGSVPAGTAPADVMTLHLAEDAWNGNAQFRLNIDGKQISTPQQVVALHGSGAWEDLTFAGNFGTGPHTVGIQFTNDAYGGTPVTDRNLYVNGIDVNGQHYGSGVTTLLSNGSATFVITTKY